MVLNDVFLKFGMVKLKNRATHKIILVGIGFLINVFSNL